MLYCVLRTLRREAKKIGNVLLQSTPHVYSGIAMDRGPVNLVLQLNSITKRISMHW